MSSARQAVSAAIGSGGLLGGDAFGNACPGRHQRIFGGPGRRAVEGRRAEHTIADLDAVDALTERIDGARDLEAEPAR
nr:hypothetical protein [Nonomuraea sp. SYSU D8015]